MNLNMNLSNVEESGNYSPLPAGDYPVRVIDSEVRESRSGESRLSFTYQVTSGQYAGRQIFDGFSLWSSNPKAVSVAQSRLKSMALACHHPNPNFIQDSSEFHGKEMIVRTAIREYNGNEYTDVKRYTPIMQEVAQASPRAQGAARPSPRNATPPPQPAGNGAALPWE